MGSPTMRTRRWPCIRSPTGGAWPSAVGKPTGELAHRPSVPSFQMTERASPAVAPGSARRPSTAVPIGLAIVNLKVEMPWPAGAVAAACTSRRICAASDNDSLDADGVLRHHRQVVSQTTENTRRYRRALTRIRDQPFRQR